MKKFNTCWVVLACIFANATASCADEGNPVAIRMWPDGGVTVETMWNLHVGANLTEAAKAELPRPVDFNVERLKLEESATLDRLPNKSLKVTIDKPDGAMSLTSNAVEISKNGSQQQEADHDPNTYIVDILVDGVEIICLNRVSARDVAAALKNENAQPAEAPTWRLPFDFKIDITIDVIIANNPSYDEAILSKIASALKPQYVIVNSSISKIGDYDVTAIPHNTIAVSLR